MELRVPMVLAVTAWAASALAVLGYTYIAFKETATDLEGMILDVNAVQNPLIAAGDVLDAELKPEKQLDRERFKKSKGPAGPSGPIGTR